jgi:CRISPR/Cas system-associated protein Cas10 (large subunit of type III CRISPR-Cas system)
MTTWEVQGPYNGQERSGGFVNRYTAIVDDRTIGYGDTSDEAHEAIIRELVKRLNRYEAREKLRDWYDLRDELFSQGYKPFVNDIDREVAMQPCPVCGARGEYYGFEKRDSYRAFSVCRACGHVMEF